LFENSFVCSYKQYNIFPLICKGWGEKTKKIFKENIAKPLLFCIEFATIYKNIKSNKERVYDLRTSKSIVGNKRPNATVEIL
jgi:hypothetical protein